MALSRSFESRKYQTKYTLMSPAPLAGTDFCLWSVRHRHVVAAMPVLDAGDDTASH